MKSITTIRATVLKITPTFILFSSIFESKPFYISATDIQNLNIDEEYDIEIEIERNDNGQILEGKLFNIHELNYSEDPWTAWKEWYKAVNE